MNLIKLFNFKYLKQNLKKSRGLLTLMILVIPVLTTLMLISLNNSRYDCAIEEVELSIINLFGMYIIPVLLSIVLLGYIYKKSSVDFINSMPLNRKTIYFTNFIGGLIIILAIQVLTLIASLICANVFTDLFVPIGMVVDTFLMMLAAYIFVYSATMLAMTLSGNILTQIVVTALILFLIPFSHMIFTIENISFNDVSIDYGEGTVFIEERNQNPEYTKPAWMLSYMASGSGEEAFSTISFVKMIILSIVYLILGMYLFEKRKMENLGSSFATLKMHYIVKALTMVPMIFLICMAEVEDIYLLISFTVIFIYYVLYDFILSKKVKFKYTILGFVSSVLVLVGVFHGGNFIAEKISLPNRNISIEKIDYIAVNEMTSWDVETLIKDEVTIKRILKDIDNTEQYWAEINTAVNMTVIEDTDIYKEAESVELRIHLNNGKDIYAYARISRPLFVELSSMENEENVVKAKEMAIALDYELLSEEVANEMLEKIYNIGDLSDDVLGTGRIFSRSLTIYYYDNHTLNTEYFDISINKEIFEIATREFNRRTYEAINGEVEFLEENSAYARTYIYDEYTEQYDNDGISFDISQEFINYVNNHYTEKCDFKNAYVVIELYGTVDETCCLNMTSELLNIISKDSEWESESYLEDAEVVYMQ